MILFGGKDSNLLQHYLQLKKAFFHDCGKNSKKMRSSERKVSITSIKGMVFSGIFRRASIRLKAAVMNFDTH